MSYDRDTTVQQNSDVLGYCLKKMNDFFYLDSIGPKIYNIVM